MYSLTIFIPVWSIIPDTFFVFYDLTTKWTLKCKFAVATSHVAHMWAELKHSWPQISLQLWLLPTDYPSPLHPFSHITLLYMCYIVKLNFRFVSQFMLPSSLLLATLGNSCFLKTYFSTLEMKVSQALRQLLFVNDFKNLIYKF